MTGFFDDYPRFFSTGVTTPSPNRINHRHRILYHPYHIVIDTNIALDSRPAILLGREDHHHPCNAVRNHSAVCEQVIVGLPSLPALQLILDAAGFDLALSNGHDGSVSDWANLEDYRDGDRITDVATNRRASP